MLRRMERKWERKSECCLGLPRLRSGFRPRAHAPAKRFNFAHRDWLRESQSCAQDDKRCRALDERALFRLGEFVLSGVGVRLEHDQDILAAILAGNDAEVNVGGGMQPVTEKL